MATIHTRPMHSLASLMYPVTMDASWEAMADYWLPKLCTPSGWEVRHQWVLLSHVPAVFGTICLSGLLVYSKEP